MPLSYCAPVSLDPLKKYKSNWCKYIHVCEIEIHVSRHLLLTHFHAKTLLSVVLLKPWSHQSAIASAEEHCTALWCPGMLAQRSNERSQERSASFEGSPCRCAATCFSVSVRTTKLFDQMLQISKSPTDMRWLCSLTMLQVLQEMRLQRLGSS